MGVSPRGFEKRELKNNYRNLSRHYHPDKNSDANAGEKFR